jgi:hypothetical protein
VVRLLVQQAEHHVDAAGQVAHLPQDPNAHPVVRRPVTLEQRADRLRVLRDVPRELAEQFRRARALLWIVRARRLDQFRTRRLAKGRELLARAFAYGGVGVRQFIEQAWDVE